MNSKKEKYKKVYVYTDSTVKMQKKSLKVARKKDILPKKWTMNRLMVKFTTTIKTKKK